MTALVGRVRAPTVEDLARYAPAFAAALYVAFLAFTAPTLSWDIWAAFVIAPVLFAATMPLLRRGLRSDPDPRIARIVLIAFVAKMLGAGARYALTYGLYERADASEYHLSGARLAAAFWNGTWAQVYPTEMPELSGTPFIRLVSGLVYVVTGPTRLGGFVVFAWLSFIGLFFFYKACVLAFPQANHRRYAYLVFFLPSMLYWPSSIGKEAWISFGLGLSSYGIALILRHQPFGYGVTALGLLATAGPRPHITILCVVSLMLAYILRRRSWRESKMGPVGKVVGVVVLLGAGVAVASAAASFFDVDGVSGGSVDQVLNYTEGQSTQGGSEFEPHRVKSPAEFPDAAMAVLFRPWLWEASSAPAFIASVEGTMLLLLGALAIPRLVKLPRYVFQVPYVAYAVTYTIMFVIAFSSIGNFGILTRQRTQVLPLVCVLLVLPTESRRTQVAVPTLEERMHELAISRRGPVHRSAG